MYSKIKAYEGVIFACLSGALYGTLAIFGINLMRQGLSIGEFSFWRFFVASVLTFVILKVRKEKLTINKPALMVFLISGLFYSAATGLYFVSMEFIGSGLAMVLFFLFPIPVIFCELIFDKLKPSIPMVIAFFAVLLGLLFLADFTLNFSRIEGILIGLICAICFGIYFYVSQKYIKNMSLWAGTFWICLGNLVGFSVVAGLQTEFVNPLSWSIILNVVLLAVITTVLPIYFVYKAMRYISAAMASILSVFEPIVTIILGWLCLNEHLSPCQITGIAIILVSVVYIHVQENANLPEANIKVNQCA